MFKEIKSILKDLGDDVMLPAGVLITGGGARLNNIETLVRDALKLPTKTVYSNVGKIAGNPEFSVSYGLCIWGANNESDTGIKSVLKKWLSKVTNLLKKLMP
jgi:cell division ATPase FtsA